MKTAEKYIDILKNNALFKGFDEDSICRAVDLMSGKICEYKKGEFAHNDYEKYLYFGLLLSGCVEACVDDIDGNRLIMADVAVGTTFGESLAFLEIENSPVYVYASENSTVLWLKPDVFYGENTDKIILKLQRNFTEIIAMRPLQMNKRIQILSKIKLRDRIITYLSSLSDEKNKKIINVPLNREDMATYIGANRTALSRELSAMKKEGIIDYYKNTFYILH